MIEGIQPDQRRFDERAVRDIITRAVEIDRGRVDTLSFPQLKSIAAELNISEAALMIAVRDRSADQNQQSVIRPIRLVARWTLIGGAAVLVTAAAYAVSEVTPFGWVVSALLAASGLRALFAVGANPHGRFQAGNFGLWFGVTGAQAIAVLFNGGSMWADTLIRAVVVPMGTLWLITAVAGAAVVQAKTMIRTRMADSGGSLSQHVMLLKARARTALRHWIDAVLERSVLRQVMNRRGAGRCTAVQSSEFNTV